MESIGVKTQIENRNFVNIVTEFIPVPGHNVYPSMNKTINKGDKDVGMASMCGNRRDGGLHSDLRVTASRQAGRKRLDLPFA